MPVTTISRRFCQRERFKSVESLRVISFEPAASTIISPHVNTIVPLSLKKPCRQKINWSGLRRMAGLLRCDEVIFGHRAGQPYHTESRDNESYETRHQPLPISASNKIKSKQNNPQPQQHASEKPQRRTLGRDTHAHGPPKTAKENGAEQKSSRQIHC